MKSMTRKLLIAALALSLLATGAVLAQGQEGQAQGQGQVPCCPTCGRPQRPQGEHAQRPGNPLARMMRELNLTDAQRQQIGPIMQEFRQQGQARREAHRASLGSILTAEQKAPIEQKRAEDGRKPWGIRLEQLNLSDDQKARLATLREQTQTQRQADMQNLKTRLASILTAEQRSKLDQVLQQRQDRPAGPRQGGPRGPGQGGQCPRGAGQ